MIERWKAQADRRDGPDQPCARAGATSGETDPIDALPPRPGGSAAARFSFAEQIDVRGWAGTAILELWSSGAGFDPWTGHVVFAFDEA